MAETVAVLYISGIEPVVRHFWYMCTRYEAHSFASSLRTLAGSMSGPVAFWGFSFCSSFSTPWDVISILGMVRAGSPSGVGFVLLPVSWVNTDWYCWFRMFALSCESLWSLPFSFKGATPELSPELSFLTFTAL
ncbi:hypothetical protein DPMN_154586 [Dreissena polymorpha]|uniref:Uncharacterized protein n=1 Tax=Dreissena polymorpha TaxID=45954 RepID=A0A9D4JA25_DREPO|nr:hypothetical protein DPMN_154586 [Dreissena polymorpha]